MDVIKFCKNYYHATNIPISFYSDKEKAFISIPSDFIYAPPFSMNESSPNPCFQLTPSHGFYGGIRLSKGEGTLYLGPCYNVRMNDAMLHNFMKEHAITSDRKDEVSRIIQTSPSINYVAFLRHLALVYFCFYNEEIDIEQHLITLDAERTKEYQTLTREESANKKDLQVKHNSYSVEQQLYHLIQDGNPVKLQNYIEHEQEIASVNEGVMADTPLRQCKNIFIGTITKMGVLAAIPAGLDVEETYQLIDTYTLECEHSNSIDEILNLHYISAMDFCNRISELQRPVDISPELYTCMSYIRNHTNEHINISDVASHIHRSNSYVVKQFKNELGINIGAFIMRCKLEEAKSLLTYSKRTLAEISNYLCFSSQSYFQNVFKKQYGVTPMQYRKQHHI